MTQILMTQIVMTQISEGLFLKDGIKVDGYLHSVMH